MPIAHLGWAKAGLSVPGDSGGTANSNTKCKGLSGALRTPAAMRRMRGSWLDDPGHLSAVTELSWKRMAGGSPSHAHQALPALGGWQHVADEASGSPGVYETSLKLQATSRAKSSSKGKQRMPRVQAPEHPRNMPRLLPPPRARGAERARGWEANGPGFSLQLL